ncbi:hypothetical protein RI129_003239 [Pyrocoelia pectoralis]|uniref:DUF4371 domain-containing protein n=1 Tax=Pyrocoelia pectoralis TaxID=417401 RepID=A0AAN7ZMT7_9COLE
MSSEESDSSTCTERGGKRLRCETPEFKKLKRGESTKKAKHRAQKYRTEWESNKDFKGWLSADSGKLFDNGTQNCTLVYRFVVVSLDSGKARCRACNATFVAEISVVKNHAKSAKHLLKIKAMPTTSSVADLFKKKVDTSEDKQIKRAEIKLAAYLTEHNISFNSVDHLTSVIKECFPDSKIAKGIVLNRTKATQVVKNVIGRCCEENIDDLLKVNKFSLIIDESTDIAAIKTLCVCVRFFYATNEKITTLYWKLIQIFSGNDPDQANEGATAERLFTEITKAIESHNIPMTNIIGFASDGCNSMFGKRNSVSSRLKEALPGIMVQKCICHSLHLCASEACKCLPRRCEDMARNIYNFFKHSSKRQAIWLSLLSVVKRIIEQWEPLRLFFTANYVEHRLLASEEIYQDLNDKSIKLFYIFLHWILPKFVDLNKFFQSDKVVITLLHDKGFVADIHDSAICKGNRCNNHKS